MENIIKTIEDNRQELINKYFALKAEKQQKTQAIMTAGLPQEESYRLWNERADLASKINDVFHAINELGNALYHLGHRVETFWGK